jgi:hypothetical protein
MQSAIPAHLRSDAIVNDGRYNPTRYRVIAHKSGGLHPPYGRLSQASDVGQQA